MSNSLEPISVHQRNESWSIYLIAGNNFKKENTWGYL